jgi:hypothetical protein
LAATQASAQNSIQIQCPTDIVVDSCTNIQEFYTPAVTDTGCGTSWTLVCTPPSGAYFAPGITTVNCTATDTCGASNSCSFTVSVLFVTNSVANCGTNCLQVEGPGDMTVTTCSNCAVIYFGAYVSDCCTGTVTTTYNPPSGSCFPLGVTPLQVSTVDTCGNTNYCIFYINVIQEDTNTPVITSYPPAVYICEANGCGAMPDDTSLVQATAGANISQSIPPGTILYSDTVVTFSAANACGYATNCTVPVVLQDCTTNTSCCGSNLGPQTIQWLPLSLSTNFSSTSQVLGDANTCETWLVTNLSCYGRVLITETFPGDVTNFSNMENQYLPNPGGSFVNVEAGYGPYDWADLPGLNFLTLAGAENYTLNFYFLDGQPNPCTLWLTTGGLGVNTTATVSQPVVFRGEYDLIGESLSAHTSISGVTNAGTVGTVIGSYYKTDSYGDEVNTGVGLFQPADPLQTTSLPEGAYANCPGYPASTTVPYLSLNVSQENGDGIGFNIGNVCCSKPMCCLMVSNPPSNIVITSCYPTSVAYPTPVVTDDCCSNVSVMYNPASSFGSGSMQAVRLFGFGNTPVQCIVSDSCGNTNIYNFVVDGVYAGTSECNPWFNGNLTNTFTMGTFTLGGSNTSIFWVSPGPNAILQTTTNLAQPNWVPVTNYVPLSGAVVPNSLPSQFYRIYSPTN